MNDERETCLPRIWTYWTPLFPIPLGIYQLQMQECDSHWNRAGGLILDPLSHRTTFSSFLALLQFFTTEVGPILQPNF